MTDVPAVPPFRFGVVAGTDRSAADLATFARQIEDVGFATLLCPDTLRTPSPYPTLAVAAAATTTLRLGTWVLASPYRTPGQVVRETATLRAISGDRFELGVGAGRPGGEHDASALGVTWGSAGQRVRQVAAILAAARADCSPLRVVVAGQGPRMLELAAQYADTAAVGLSPVADGQQLLSTVARVRDAESSVGRTGPLEVSLQIAGVGDALPDWISQHMGLSAADLESKGAVGWLPGDADAAAERLMRLRDLAGVSYVTVPEQFVDVVAPVVRRLSGSR